MKFFYPYRSGGFYSFFLSLLAFSHSTVVSICCSSRHVDSGGVVRFPLNGPLHPHLDGGAIDLHTSLSPIFNGDPSATIKTLGLDNGVQDGDEIILYAVQNKRTSKDPPVKLVGRSAIYTVREDWVSYNPPGYHFTSPKLLVATVRSPNRTRDGIISLVFACLLGLPLVRSSETIVCYLTLLTCEPAFTMNKMKARRICTIVFYPI